MARWTLNLEHEGDELQLSYGFDRSLGFFATVECGGNQTVDYDAMDADYDGLPGLLDVLIESGAFAREQIEEALTSLMIMDSSDIEDTTTRQAAIVIENLKMAAGD